MGVAATIMHLPDPTKERVEPTTSAYYQLRFD